MSANVQQLRAGCAGATAGRRGPVRADALIGVLRRLLDSVGRARRRRIAIDHLSRLDERQLEDIGLRPEQIPELVYRRGSVGIPQVGGARHASGDLQRL